MSQPLTGQVVGRVAECLAVFGLILATCLWPQTALAQGARPTPTADPFAVPKLPENPTQLDVGRTSYYYNCMPCHGDKGQGLTEAWRQTWVEDHRNCWEHGCHSGRAGDEGFPLPETISAVAGPETNLDRFSSPEDLHRFLVDTHPPQRPGALPEEEYWALTAYLLAENGRLAPGSELGLGASQSEMNPGPIIILTMGVTVAGMAILFRRGRSRRNR